MYPTVEEIADKLAEYVDVRDDVSGDRGYVDEVAQEVVDWLAIRPVVVAGTLPVSVYERAALDVGAQLFRRKRSWGNVDQLEAVDLPPVRNDPYSVAYPILRPYEDPVVA